MKLLQRNGPYVGFILFLFIELSTKKTKLGYVYDADRNELIKSYKFRGKNHF